MKLAQGTPWMARELDHGRGWGLWGPFESCRNLHGVMSTFYDLITYAFEIQVWFELKV